MTPRHDRGLGAGTDISAADLDVEAEVDPPETADPEAFDDDGTLGGQGGTDRTGGGAG